MKRCFWLLAFSLMAGCSKSEPGTINVELTFDPSVTTTTQQSIEQFVFLIGDQRVSQRLLFPQDCLGCLSATSPCPTPDQCLEVAACGFASTLGSFEANISFSAVEDGALLEIIACALDDAQDPVAEGVGVAFNDADSEASISLTTDTTNCSNSLPPPCP